jgi:hypothetical protein
LRQSKTKAERRPPRQHKSKTQNTEYRKRVDPLYEASAQICGAKDHLIQQFSPDVKQFTDLSGILTCLFNEMPQPGLVGI